MWALIGLSLLISLVLFFLFKKPIPEQPPVAAGELDIPKVNEGDEVGRVHGSYWIKDPQVAWFGDQASEPIKKSGGGKK